MNDSAFVFLLFLLTLLIGGALVYWERRRAAPMSRAFKVSLQTLLQVMLILGIFLRSVEFYAEQVGYRPLLDFTSFYASGRLFLENPQQLYSAQHQLRRQEEVSPLPLSDEDFLAFPYPPFMAAYLAVPAVLAYSSAYRLFLILNLLTLGATIYLLVLRLQMSRQQARLLSLVTTASFPVYITLKQGQLSLTMGLLTTGFWLSFLGSGRHSSAFLWGAALTGKPTLTSVPLLELLLRRRWKTLTLLGSAAAALWLVPTLWTGTGIWRDYVDLARGMSSGEYTVLSSMCGLRGLDVWLAGGHHILLALSSIIVLAAIWRARNWALNSWGCASLILATLLLAPHLYVHDLVLILPVVGFILHGLPVLRSGTFYLLFLFGLTPLLTFLWGGQLGLEPPFLALPMLGAFFYGVSRWRGAQAAPKKAGSPD